MGTDIDGIADEFHRERVRAHAKHGDGSMEAKSWDDPVFVYVVGEEWGEVAHAFCEWRLGKIGWRELRAELRTELIQVGAMVEAWVASIDRDIDSGVVEPVEGSKP